MAALPLFFFFDQLKLFKEQGRNKAAALSDTTFER